MTHRTNGYMIQELSDWNKKAKSNTSIPKAAPDIRKWEKGRLFGWRWIGGDPPETVGSWVTYRASYNTSSYQGEHTQGLLVYIWEGPEPPKGEARPLRPDIAAVAAMNTPEGKLEKEKEEAVWRAEAQVRRQREAERAAAAAASWNAAEAADQVVRQQARREQCIKEFGQFQVSPMPGGTRKKRKNRGKKRSRRYK